MPSKKEENLIFFRFVDGEDVFDSLNKLAQNHNFDSGVILCGVGMLRNLEIGFLAGKEGYVIDEYQEPVEILSLSGNISHRANRPFCHIHVALGQRDKSAFGGHLIRATVHNTLEGVVRKFLKIKLTRDSETGTLRILED